MKKNLLLALILLVVSVSSNYVFAVKAKPGTTTFTQPDRSKITLILKGDERVHWATTTDGYTVLNDKSGTYVYAVKAADGTLGFSDVQAHDAGNRPPAESAFVSGLGKNLFFSHAQIRDMKAILRAKRNNTDAPASGTFPTTGTRKLLMILANFSNTTTTYTQSSFNNLMNQVNYNGTGSFRDFYLEVSYGMLTVNTTVSTWVTLPHTHDYYGPEPMWATFAHDAVVAANTQTGVNFAEFDNDGDGYVDGVSIIHQGRGQEESGDPNDIWSHSWNLLAAGFSAAQCTFDGVIVDSYTTQPEKGDATSMCNIGVLCHEFGHNLGAPDFYDTDYGTGGEYEGTGYWDVMSGGSWNGNGVKPAHPCAWVKADFGWTTPLTLSTAQQVMLRNAQVFQDVVKYNTTTPGEYFLVENRQQTGFDTYIPGHGLIIYHVDDNYISLHYNDNDINATAHQGNYPMAANSTTANGIMLSPGTIETTGCPWPGTTNETTFSDASMPNSKSWAGANTGTPLINIAENNSTKEVTFCYISCSPTLTVTPPNQNVPATAGNTTFTVTTTSAWTAVSNQSWCTVTPSGTGNGTITATCQANTGASRVANITVTVTGISPVVVTVSQSASTPTLTVTPPSQIVTAAAGSTTFNVTSNSSWTTVSDQTWCTVTPSGSGNGTITASYTANTAATGRTATITVTVSGLSPVLVTVVQDGVAPLLSVTPSNQNVPATPGGTTTFDVSSTADWTVTSDASWCQATAGGSGNGTITATYFENTTTSSRVAHLNVTVTGLAPVVVTVSQAAGLPVLAVTPPDQYVNSPAGSASFTVTSNSAWTAVSDASWCTVTPGGTGNAELITNFTQNTTSTERIASITVTVAGIPSQTVKLHQSQVTGIGSPAGKEFSAVPNPTSGIFRITTAIHNPEVSILDMTGRTILHRSCKNDEDLTFDLSAQVPGCYLVKIGTEVFRVVKN